MTPDRPGSGTPNSWSNERASSSGMAAVSASMAAQTPMVPSGRPEGIDEPSSRFATTTHGFSVSGASPRRSFLASSSNPSSRSRRSSESAACARSRVWTSDGAPSFAGRPFRRLRAFSSADSTLARSASTSSAVISASSSAGFASGPNARSTTHSASVSRSAATDWAPRPLGTSTNRTWAATTFRECSSSVSTPSRGSGTSTTAWFDRPPIAPVLVRAVNNVDAPEYGTPTNPTSFTRPPQSPVRELR